MTAAAAAIREPAQASGREALDAESAAWLRALDATGPERDDAVERLHALLLRAAVTEVARRRSSAPAAAGDLDDLANQAADDALMAVLRKLHSYRGDSRFTTWAYKFALLEAAAAMRRRPWHGRELPLEADGWARFPDGRTSPAGQAEAVGADRRHSRRDRRGAHPTSARRARRAHAQRRPDRRARGASRYDAQRPLQDAPRRPAQATRAAGRERTPRCLIHCSSPTTDLRTPSMRFGAARASLLSRMRSS